MHMQGRREKNTVPGRGTGGGGGGGGTRKHKIGKHKSFTCE